MAGGYGKWWKSLFPPKNFQEVAALVAILVAFGSFSLWVIRFTADLTRRSSSPVVVPAPSTPQSHPSIVPPTPTSPPVKPKPETPVAGRCGNNLLINPWHLEAAGGPAEEWIDFADPSVFKGIDFIRVTYNLHGLVAREGTGKNDSVIVLTQPNWFGVSLAKRGENGHDGEQVADLFLTEFKELPNQQEGIVGGAPLAPLDIEPISSIRARFWDFNHFIVDITSITLCAS